MGFVKKEALYDKKILEIVPNIIGKLKKMKLLKEFVDSHKENTAEFTYFYLIVLWKHPKRKCTFI